MNRLWVKLGDAVKYADQEYGENRSLGGNEIENTPVGPLRAGISYVRLGVCRNDGGAQIRTELPTQLRSLDRIKREEARIVLPHRIGKRTAVPKNMFREEAPRNKSLAST
ncbi:hypothetical protein B0H11DRAFT_1927201 [Mycena galericulata]|nr:hypothetical protein B0H11DRAFT_1927201 [Mycena galericulata]